MDGRDAQSSAAEAALAADAAAPAEDARFEDAVEPLRLLVRDSEDLAVLAALLQDAALLVGDIAWLPREMRFAFVANRYRWEEPDALERVRCGVRFEGVTGVRARGLDVTAKSRPVAILTLGFTPNAANEDPGGVLRMTLSGDAELEISVEALEAAAKDLTRPWKARRRPHHPEDAATGEA